MTDKEKNNKDFDLFQNDLFGSSESKNSADKDSLKPDPVKPEPQSSTSNSPVEPVGESPEPPAVTVDKTGIPEPVKPLGNADKDSLKSDPLKPEPQSSTSNSPVAPVGESPEPPAVAADKTEISELVKPLGNAAGKSLEEEPQAPVVSKPEESGVDAASKEIATTTPKENSPQNNKEPELNLKQVENPVHTEGNKIIQESQHTTRMKKSLFRKKEKVIDTAHFGIILSTARENSGLDIDYIASETKIKKDYIVALENEAYDKLPQKVYIRAYIRKLGHLYGLPDSQIEEINSTLMQDIGVLDEEVYSALVSLPEEDDDDLNGRVRSLPAIIIPVFGIIILLGLLILGGWLLFSYLNSKPKTTSEDASATFDSTKLEKFEPDQLIKMGEMPLPD